jgi:hypothetical protein
MPMGRNYYAEHLGKTGRHLGEDIRAQDLENLKAAWREAGDDQRAEFMVWAGWLNVQEPVQQPVEPAGERSDGCS